MKVPSQILLVDANPPDRGILRNRLVDAGHSVHEEADWQQGLVLAKEHSWDAILVASRIDGVLFGKLMPQHVQEHAKRALITVVVYQARQGGEDADAGVALKNGADTFVHRDELPAMVGLVERLVLNRRSLAQAEDKHRALVHRQKILTENPPGDSPGGPAGALEAVMLADQHGVVLASDAGAGRLTGSSPVGESIGKALPHLDTERLVARSSMSPLVSEPFEQPGMGSAGVPLELNMVPLVPNGDGPALKLALVSQSPFAKLPSKVIPSPSSWSVQRQTGLQQAANNKFGLASFLGISPLVQALRDTAQQASRSTRPFLLIGAPGSGARTLARAIHNSANPLAPIEQVQAEVLTGRWLVEAMQAQANQEPKSYLVANVDRMSLEDQALLAKPIPNVRMLFTSSSSPHALHPKLAAAIGDRFVVLPGLCEHMEDLPLIANHFAGTLETGVQIELEAMQALMGYPWPGNISELEGSLRFAHLAASKELCNNEPVRIKRQHLPESILQYRFHASRGHRASEDHVLKPWQITDSDPISFDLYERKVILRALDHCKDNRLACARLLRLGKSTLYRKLKRLGIDTGE